MKRTFDILVSCLLLIMLLPLFFIISFSILATSPGPVFFVQNRIGLKGRVFKMFKFRTMVNHAENSGTGLFSFEGDPRITKVGYLLRRYSLDELPQLINVLIGTMSIVGPRPPVTYELGPWNEFTPEMRRRFDVKPGITGLAQVLGRNDLTWDQKITYDNLYVERVETSGFCADIPILIGTVWVVLAARGTIESYQHQTISDDSVASRARKAGLNSSFK